jgi:hypothetical protein
MRMIGTSSRTNCIAGVALGMVLLSITLVPAQTTQNFATGTAYSSGQIGTTIQPIVMGGGPAGANFLRLLSTASTAGTNTIAFQRTDFGASNQIVADFDFRMTPGTGQGEGLGFALLNTVTYDRFGTVLGPAEEPNFTGSLGIGFDIRQDGGETNGNHVSVHFNNAKVAEVDAGSVALAGSQWIRAHIVVRPGSGFSDVSVTLTPSSTGTPVNLIVNQPVPGLQPYESRVYFAARSTASQTAEHDLANVQVAYTADPALFGKWGGVLPLPIVPIHSTLLPNGKIICWDRSQAANTDTIPRLIDAATLDIPANNVNWTTAADPGFEIFCSSHTVTADGKLFVAGGHKLTDGNGLDTSFLYDGATNVWTRLPDMGTVGRWYPSVCKLANGNIVVMAGNKTEATGANSAIQLMTFNGAGSGTWSTLTGATRTMACFPMLHLAPNGKLFHAGPEKTGGFLDTAGNGSWSFINSNKGFRDYGCSVLYDEGKVLLLGGGTFEANGRPTATAEVIDLKVLPTPSWRLVGSMAYQRRQCNAVVLPDGTVLVTGGTSFSGFSDPAGSVLAAELWDPTTENFRMLAGMSIDRSYHFESILLPDGRVLSQGSGHGGGPLPAFNGEVYSPPYLFKGARPALSDVPARVIYNQGFSVTSTDAADVTGVSLIAVTSVTHATNFNQRLVRPTFTVGINQINITTPGDPNLCPPGPYLLFLLNSAGIPSQGKFILVNYNQPPVASTGGAITAEALDSNGAAVQFNGTSSTDIDSNITTYEWYEGMNLLATGSTPTVTLAPGVHTITLKVIDGGSLSSTTSFTVTIQDTTGPSIQTLTAAPNLLRSLNTNQYLTVTLTATATDAVDPAPTAQALSVLSTEATSGLFPGDLSPDWQSPVGLTVQLRPERKAILRRYTLSAGATDASGNASTPKTVDVKVRGKWFP